MIICMTYTNLIRDLKFEFFTRPRHSQLVYAFIYLLRDSI